MKTKTTLNVIDLIIAAALLAGSLAYLITQIL